ncbi:unnamed protein product [Linum tenue]|uniref:Uncharacterized protein n=1 Tax=Linum tenue TaxID=586396 RepID=A0AAV0I2R5_9ROSI|nr:unnamed protein product [Linum tenue]
MESGNKGSSAGSNNNQAASSAKCAAAGSSSVATGSGTMKAPGADHHISRAEFEKNPSAYFQNLHKK